MISIALFCCFEKVFTHINVDDWKKITETSLPEKEDFYSQLNMEDITDEGYTHAKSLQKNRTKNFVEDHHLYVQSNTLLSADVFDNFLNMSLEILSLLLLLFYIWSAPILEYKEFF